MIDYTTAPARTLKTSKTKIASFIKGQSKNIDWETVQSFGHEWSKFKNFSDEEIKAAGDEYFDIINTTIINKDSICLDIGCGGGRWTKYIADKVKFVEAIDPSEAVYAAESQLENTKNIRITQVDIDNLPFPPESFDFVFSLGVLHHIPNTALALEECISMLKPGGYCFFYLYYDFENRSPMFRSIYWLSNLIRLVVSKLPTFIKKIVCEVLTVLIYLPPIFLCRLLIRFPKLKNIATQIPLSNYRNKSYHIIRNDALDRFGTPLEQRFNKAEIKSMTNKAGLTNVIFSEQEPFWHFIAKKTHKKQENLNSTTMD